MSALEEDAHFCRTCLKPSSEETFSIITCGLESPNLKDKLKFCLPHLDLDERHGYRICGTCSNSVRLTYKFHRLCLETEKKLKDGHPSQIGIKKEVVEVAAEEAPHTPDTEPLVIVRDKCAQVPGPPPAPPPPGEGIQGTIDINIQIFDNNSTPFKPMKLPLTKKSFNNNEKEKNVGRNKDHSYSRSLNPSGAVASAEPLPKKRKVGEENGSGAGESVTKTPSNGTGKKDEKQVNEIPADANKSDTDSSLFLYLNITNKENGKESTNSSKGEAIVKNKSDLRAGDDKYLNGESQLIVKKEVLIKEEPKQTIAEIIANACETDPLLKNHVPENLDCHVNLERLDPEVIRQLPKLCTRPVRCFCVLCNRMIKRTGYKCHQRRHVENEPVFPCLICYKKYFTVSFVKRHMHECHKNKITALHLQQLQWMLENHKHRKQPSKYNHNRCYCERCRRDFKGRSRLESHMELHTQGHVTFTCHICSKAYFVKRQLRKHMTIYHVAKADATSSDKPNETEKLPSTQKPTKHANLQILNYLTQDRDKSENFQKFSHAKTKKNMLNSTKSNGQQHTVKPAFPKPITTKPKPNKTFTKPSQLNRNVSARSQAFKPKPRRPNQTAPIKIEPKTEPNDFDDPAMLCRTMSVNENASSTSAFDLYDNDAGSLHVREGVNIGDVMQVSFSCKLCKISFNSHNLLSLHALTHVRSTQKCDICDQVFGSEREYALHVSMCSQADQDNDPGQNFPVITTPPAKTKESPTPSPGFKCSKCPKVFANQVNLRRHVSQAHGSGLSVRCNKCPARFESLITLNKHIATHSKSPARPAESPPSSNEFAVMHGRRLLPKPASELKRPAAGVAIKAAPKPQQPPSTTAKATRMLLCNNCKQTFIEKRQFDEHDCRTMTVVPVYDCQICKSVFYGRVALIEHMAVHMADKD